MRNPFPSYNWYVTDWLSSEAHATLTLEQQGAYRNLLDHAWLSDPPCSLPDDDKVLAHFSGLGKKWRKSAAIIRQWFVVREGRLVNEMQLKKFREALRVRQAKRAAGKKGNDKRWEEQRKAKSQRDRTAIGTDDSGIPEFSPLTSTPTPIFKETTFLETTGSEGPEPPDGGNAEPGTREPEEPDGAERADRVLQIEDALAVIGRTPENLATAADYTGRLTRDEHHRVLSTVKAGILDGTAKNPAGLYVSIANATLRKRHGPLHALPPPVERKEAQAR